ncbi:hypothetical protein LCGC14_0368600 [marine sediment metagenome]|uniref:Uncharacterized protein n=1 Tax=marine sediment metagenome TaxID=412755 RepID=A0A0F9WEG6_9ZZZZ
MRIVTPKVHVEVYRPTHIPKRSISTGEISGIRIDPSGLPNTLRYIQQTEIKDRRIKGIQFEETALFGGFIEINIAEDPKSSLFDRFNPNDHVEVFYDDTGTKKETGGILTSVGSSGEYNYQYGLPKFQGATWKSELKYTPTMVTTQLHAWDYLRLLQYINIPRGERGKERATVIENPAQKAGVATKLYAKTQKIKYQDDFLDYIDSAFNAFVDSHDKITIFGQELMTTESQYDGRVMKKGLKYVKSRKLTKPVSNVNETNLDKKQPVITFYNGGVGKYCHKKLRETRRFSGFEELEGWKDSFDKRAWDNTTNDPDIAILEPTDVVIKIGEMLNNMEQHDIFQFRFIDGEFEKLAGTSQAVSYGDGVHYVADIIAISQFALIELLLKKLTLDHGLNQWFTPLVKFDSNFLNELKTVGHKIGKKVSKLVYIRLRKVDEENFRESTVLAFNGDTYNLIAKYATDAFKLTIGNLKKRISDKGEKSSAEVDIFSEIIASIDFPQPEPSAEYGGKPNTRGIYSLQPLVTDNIGINSTKFISGEQLYEDLMKRFDANFQLDASFERQSDISFYTKLVERVTNHASFIQDVLSKDDKIISYIKSVPASYQRADIYTGSKFNTIQYDSLAITRMIQLIASNMAGFPATNNPRSNITVTKATSPEKGRIDSYPIFAANRIVIRPRVFFGEEIELTDEDEGQFRLYNLYPSLSQMAAEKESKKQVDAVCFIVLEIGKKKLKAANEDPEFIFPMEDIQDFGMIKASSVNHFFNFSIADHFGNFNVLEDLSITDSNKNFYSNITTNGIFLEYREGGLSSVGFSPPEHQHLKLEDLTQNSDYSAWSNRFSANTNIRSKQTGEPVFNPRTAYINRQVKAKADIKDNFFIINNYDDWNEQIEIELKFEKDGDKTGVFWKIENGSRVDPVDHLETQIYPYHGITGYADISDLQAEYKTLELILTSKDVQYVDISNIEQSLMDNIYIRTPLIFTINIESEGRTAETTPPGFVGPLKPGESLKYKDRIVFGKPGEGEGGRQPRVHKEQKLSTIVEHINFELDKIGRKEMMWLFPISGHNILPDGVKTAPNLDEDREGLTSNPSWRKHLLLLTYLDLLVKGIRYLLWSIAKARFICHVYLPIEYDAYAKNIVSDESLSKGFDIQAGVVEPGSSVQITYDPNNTLYRTIDLPLVSFPIKGLKKGQHIPLVNSITRGTDIIKDEDRKFTKEITTQGMREMTWYVSKKVTYLGADGAMMRVEMTEGSLDWTLFYNEKNLLTQVSEHYMLNGLRNYRTGSGLI